MVPPESADCGNTSRPQETTPPLVIKTVENAAAADLALEKAWRRLLPLPQYFKYARSSCKNRRDIFDIG
ncbi:hypothetical protein MRX96_012452 [Rhipicephalus microplus]